MQLQAKMFLYSWGTKQKNHQHLKQMYQKKNHNFLLVEFHEILILLGLWFYELLSVKVLEILTQLNV